MYSVASWIMIGEFLGLLGCAARCELQMNKLVIAQHARSLAVPGGKAVFKVFR